MSADLPGNGIAGLRARASELAAEGDYAAARDVLFEALRLPGGLEEPTLFLLARVLRATSDDDRARDVLCLIRSDAVALSRAKAEEADIAWVQHDYGTGVELATHALRANPGNRRAELTLKRLRRPYTTREHLPAGSALSHVAFYVSDRGNFGDVALPPAVREAVTSVRPSGGWLSVHAHQLFDQERLELVNRTDGLVIGGGGLFLPDTAPNGNSGWQWNVPREKLEAIDVPIGVIGVGFNLFEGQSFIGDLFRENLIALVDRAVLVGLRNRGSVEQVRRLLPEPLKDKVSFLPCPTTVLKHIHVSEPLGERPGAADSSGSVLINVAFDRSSRRFGDAYGTFLGRMADYVQQLRAAGAQVRYAAHLPTDEKFVTDLATEHGITLKVDALYDLPLEDAYEVYRRASVVVGMRGHATMIPFGLGTPVLSIISHPKLRYFLEDIGRTEWGFDVHREDLAAAMAELTLEIVSKEHDYREDVARLQLELLRAVRTGVSTFTQAVAR